MASLREKMQQNPMVGWGLAAVLMLASAWMLYRNFAGSSETKELTAMVTIRCSETGDTWQVPRGVLEKELYLRPLPLDPNKGLVNPKTGKFTGFPADAWKETIDRVTAERAEAQPAGSDRSGRPKTAAGDRE